MKINFFENFINLCEESNLSQNQLSKEIGINQSQISRYFKGVIPDTKTIVKLCDYFGCSVDYIVGLSDSFVYKNMTKGFDESFFYKEYANLLDKNNLSHYKLAKKKYRL